MEHKVPDEKSRAEPQFVIDRAGWARRADVRLRALYPNLITRIFEVRPAEFVLVFDSALQDAAAIDVDEIRPVAALLSSLLILSLPLARVGHCHTHGRQMRRLNWNTDILVGSSKVVSP